jgi:hypothetical protein
LPRRPCAVKGKGNGGGAKGEIAVEGLERRDFARAGQLMSD